MNIILADYPQLQTLVWNRPTTTELTAQEAFALYERNWRHVNVRALLPREKELIQHLTATIGGGVMMV